MGICPAGDSGFRVGVYMRAGNSCRVFMRHSHACNRIDDMVVSTVLSTIEDGDIAPAKWGLAKKRRPGLATVGHPYAGYDQRCGAVSAGAGKGQW